MISAEPLLSIGAFAELTLLSVKALRLYDERGLLNPAEIDPQSGYRYYRSAQAATGRLIALLRAAGMPLREIETVLNSSNPGEALSVIESFRTTQQSAAASAQLLLDRARRHFSEDTMNTVTITQGDTPVISAMIYPRIDELDERQRETLAHLVAFAAERGLAVSGPAFGIFHGQVTAESSGPLEVCLPVDRLTGLSDAARSHRMAGATLAGITVTGADTDFPAILAAYDEACAWIAGKGFVPAGPPREIWHVLPWESGETSMTVAWPYLAG